MSSLVIPGITDEGKLRIVARATRTYDQYCRAVTNALADHCPFCQVDSERNKVFFNNGNWLVWPCTPPEKNTRLHFLLVPRRHVVSMIELKISEWGSLHEAIYVIKTGYQLTNFGLLCRDNAPELAGTIEHLHLHLMVPDGTGRVESPFYKGKEDDEASLARALVFEKLRQGAEIESLTEVERGLIEGRMG